MRKNMGEKRAWERGGHVVYGRTLRSAAPREGEAWGRPGGEGESRPAGRAGPGVRSKLSALGG